MVRGAVYGAVAGAFFGDPRVDRIDPRTRRAVASVPIPGGEIVAVAAGAGGVWVPTTDGTVDRIDPTTAQLVRTISVAKGVRAHDAFVVTTTYGRTEALDAGPGRVLWRFTPPSYGSLRGTFRITNATPALSSALGARVRWRFDVEWS